MMDYPRDIKQWWPTSRPAYMKRLILITFGLQGEWKRKAPLSYSKAHKTKKLITPLNQEPLVSSPCRSSKGTNQHLTRLPCAWHTWKRKVPKGTRKWRAKPPDSINGVMEEFMVHLAKAVKDAQVEEEDYYHCSSPETFIHNCPLVRALRENMQLNCKEGMASKKEARPLRQK